MQNFLHLQTSHQQEHMKQEGKAKGQDPQHISIDDKPKTTKTSRKGN